MTTVEPSSPRLLVMCLIIVVLPYAASGDQMHHSQVGVDEFDTHERQNDSAQTPDEQISPQQRIRSEWLILHSFQCNRNQQGNYDRIENNGGQDRRGWRMQIHNVHCFQPWQRPGE